jgi:hypothetical protein
MEYEHEELNKPALNMRESLKDVSIVHNMRLYFSIAQYVICEIVPCAAYFL